MSPVKVRQLREKHGLDRDAFGKLVWQTERAVRGWEYGERNIPRAAYELLLIKLKEVDELKEFRREEHANR